MRYLFCSNLFIGCLIFSIQLFAQPLPIKYGDVKMSDLKMDTYEADPDASVVILADIGTVNFELARGHSEYARHRRIKILKKSGFDWADISIEYNHRTGNVKGIKGITYAMEGGKLVKHKLDKKEVITEKISNFQSQKKILMPAVKEGTIIEYSYTIVSENYVVPDWYFQTTEPILYSEYRVKIPEYFNYANYYQGAVPLEINTNEKYSDTESINGQMLNYAGQYYRRVAKNVPALRPEPYMTTLRDYQAKVGYQLQAIDIPGQILHTVMEDWDKVSKELWEDEDFGLPLKGYSNGSVKKIVPGIVAKAKTEQEKMIAIYDYVKQNIGWNGIYSIWTGQSLNNVFSEKSGRSSEINLMLTLMLREAGIEAYPAILSTRSHGKMQPIYPFLDQFNHVITYVKIGEEEHWLDAIHKNRPYNLLDDNDLNQKAFLLNKANPEWKTIDSKQKYQHVASATFVLNKEGDLEGILNHSDKDYSAFYKRMNLKEKGEESYAKGVFEEDVPDMDLKKYTFENKNNLTEPLKSTYEIKVNGAASTVDGRMYLNPMLTEKMAENPFKLDKRTYPIDYGHGYNYTYIFNVEIPEGYEVEELPEATRIGLPNKACSFLYNASVNGNKLQLMSKFSINQALFVPEEYGAIKQFYDLIVAKHAEQIVLKEVK
ncbi:MAG: DUF3857 domain-containing protein [Chitinophagales bacterium]